MFVDILNKIQPIQFFMESPIWVTIVIFAVIGFFRKLLTASIMMGFEQAIEESDKGGAGGCNCLFNHVPNRCFHCSCH